MPVGLVNDAFGDGSIGAHWTFKQPKGDGTAVESGGVLTMAVPAGVDHDQFGGNRSANVLYQTVTSNGDFQIRVQLGAAQPTTNFQTAGFLVENPETNGGSSADGQIRWLRCDRLFSSQPRLFASTCTVTTNTQRLNTVLSTTWLELERATNQWTLRSSTDGVTFTDRATWSFTMTVERVGLLCGNATGGSSPAYTETFDNFQDLLGTVTYTPGTVDVDLATGGVSARAPVVAPSGGWGSWSAVRQFAADVARDERARRPRACPNDGEPLDEDRDGVLRCPWDGWTTTAGGRAG